MAKPINKEKLEAGMWCNIINWDIYGDGFVRDMQKVVLLDHTPENHWNVRFHGQGCTGTGYRSFELFPIHSD